MDLFAMGVEAIIGQTGPIGHIGPVPLYLFGITTGAGVLFGMAVALLQAERLGLSLSRTFEGAVWGIVAGFIGSRLGYVVVHWGDYRQTADAVVRLSEGGFLFHGAIAVGGVALLLYGRFAGTDGWRTLDAFAPGLALGQAVGLVGAQVLGQATKAPWGVVVQQTVIHPLPAYGIVLAYGLFFLLWRVGGGKVRSGSLFLTYLLLHGIGSFVLGFWSSARTYWGMTPTQWGGWLAVGVAVTVMYLRRNEPLQTPIRARGTGWSTAKHSFGAAFQVQQSSVDSGDGSPLVGITLKPVRNLGPRITEAALWIGGVLLLLGGFAARLG